MKKEESKGKEQEKDFLIDYSDVWLIEKYMLVLLLFMLLLLLLHGS